MGLSPGSVLGSSSLVHWDRRALLGDSLAKPDQPDADDLTHDVPAGLRRNLAAVAATEIVGV